ncbi:beta-ketoacyl synthase N-terminal-like domain-containing protein [Actinomadura sp. SCN-SB]|uniref:beta-ketoacyl synthase N-terminal-like domain-containing protein n=1 Tax=Actinomadura sp. SCN-SB TaxID=3373092 RepID=UPI0037515051
MRAPAGAGEPIAIVGMGAVFPGAGSAGAFWHNIRDGVDAVGEVPPGRWDPEVYFDPGCYERAPDSDRFYCRRGGFVDELATFDPARFGLAPSTVAGMEPDQLLALRVAAEAIEDAGGMDRLPAADRVGVVLGRAGYLSPGMARFDQRVSAAHQLTGVLAELLPELGEDRLAEIGAAFRARLGRCEDSGGLVPSFAASRIADRLDLRGPAYTLDAACASALLAVEHAVRALRGGQCDAMLAGAVHHAHHATVWSMFSRLRALSRSGCIRPFDRAADGTLLAEGTGIVLLKRLSDAERDGDRVHAVIRGVGSSSDGRAGGLLSPAVDGQVLALERAWRDAGLDPSAPGAAGLVEAHGNATPAGDEAELATLRRVFAGAAAPGGPPLRLGTVKSMIGHAMPAAGIAGLIKAACALRDGVLPPTLHIEDPHPALSGTGLRLVRKAAEWEAPPGGMPRRAVVNAFGFGGTNAHVVLEEHRSSSRVRARALVQPAFDTDAVLRLSADTPDALGELLAEVAERGAPPSTAVSEGPCRVAIVEPTARKVDLARAVVARGTPWRGRSDIWFTPRPLLGGGRGARTAFLFPGFEPAFEPRIDDVARRFGLDPPRLTGRLDPYGHATDVIATGRLLAEALARLGIEPDVTAGHGVGEWTAMIVAGLCSPEGMAAVAAAALDHGPDGGPDAVYAALGCGADRAQEIIGDGSGVAVSHDNCPHQSVICGPPGAVREVLGRLAAEGVIGQELPFRSGFHTALAVPYLGAARRSLGALAVREPRVPVWSATTAAPFPSDPDAVRDLIVRHLVEPVRFSELVEELYGTGVRAFVQVGPGSLPGFTGDRLGDRDHLALAVNVPKRDGMGQLRRVVAALWAEGYGAPPSATAGRGDGHRGPTGVRLDLGTPLVRLDGAVPPLSLEGASGGEECWPELPSHDPVMAELDALLREATAGAQSVVDAYGAGRGTGTDPRVANPAPVAEEELTTTRTFSLDAMPYLADHCVIEQPAGWPEMSDRFPVVPLATLLEVMAETARELLPELVVVGYEDVRALKWVVACPPSTASIHAHLVRDENGRGAAGGPRRVRVSIRGHADGTVLLAERYPAVPLRRLDDRSPLDGEGPPPVTARQLYGERWMFQGPRFQSVSEITAMACDGLRGVVTPSGAPGAVLDGAGQLCGHWIQVYGEKDQTVFPTGIGRVTLYGPPPPEGDRLEATVWNRTMSATGVTYDIELVRAPGGALWGRVEGWTARRFTTDEATWRMQLTPELSGVGEPQPGGWCLARRHWDGSSSRDLLMRRYLGAAERATYQRLRPRERGPWLLGRIAVKDAVRHWLWERGHGPLFPAELTVHDDGIGGHPVVTGPFDTEISVAMACADGFGVALARPAPLPAGIAIEPLPVDEAGRQDGRQDEAVRRAVLAASAGAPVPVETRTLEGHVVAWTTADPR